MPCSRMSKTIPQDMPCSILPYITGVCVLVISVIAMTVSAQNCATGWFGFNCMLKCRCNNSHSCSMDGQCPNNGPCEDGYFGPACQYAIANVTTPTAIYLLDNNDTTCNIDTSTLSVELTLSKPIPFSWYRVVVNAKEHILDFTTKLNNGIPCIDEMKYQVSDRVMDVMCRTYLRVDKLIIAGRIASSVCSVYISAGRNVALKQQVYQTSNYSGFRNSEVQAEFAVDGDTDLITAGCARTAREKNGPEFHLKYHRPMVLYTFRIYTRRIYRYSLRSFNLVTYNEEGIVTNTITGAYQVETMKEYTLPSQNPVTRLRVKGTTTILEMERMLRICELETYGDNACAEDSYGLFCQEVCSCSKNDICSPIIGLCAEGCKPGFYGESCLVKCSDTCLDGYCKFVSGQCIQCVPGFTGNFCTEALKCSDGSYGKGCASRCSDHCTNICDHDKGTCICEPHFTGARCEDCEAGFYHHSCNVTCPRDCKDNICNRTTGYCVKCNGQRFGDFCEGIPECPPGQYGLLCGLNCSDGCLKGTCEAESGICSSCSPGLTGNMCTEDVEKKSNNGIDKRLLLLLIIPACLCCLCLCYCLYRSRQNRRSQTE